MTAVASNRANELPIKSAIAIAVSMAVGGHAEQAQAQDDDTASVGIDEIVVTARKREQNLQDVSASIQAISGESLKRQGILNMEDAIRVLPSVSHIGGTAGANKIVFRGVSDNPASFIAASSAALYMDEQPLTQFSINPEPRMIDIERIEALAGPQGTLYGDSSQSGTLRIITNKPDPTAFYSNVSAMARAGDMSSASHEISGVLNLPLVEDKFAIRLVGFSARDGGFVDNVLGTSPMSSPIRGTKTNANMVQKDINKVDHLGGRISAKWFVNDDWSVTGMYIYQSTEANGRNDYDPTVGDLQTTKFFEDTRDDKWSQFAITLDGRFGDMEFISVTSYFDRDIDYVYERTEYMAYFTYNFCPTYATYCWSGTVGAETHIGDEGNIVFDPGVGLIFNSAIPNNQNSVGFNTLVQQNERFTQEFRLTSTGERYRMVLGAFYEYKTEHWEYRAVTEEFLTSLAYYYWLSLENTTMGVTFYEASGVDPSWWLSVDDTDWDQWAVFGNFSYDFSDQFSSELGLRYFDQEMDRTYFVDKPFITHLDFPDITNPKGGASDVVTKLTLTYRFDDDKLLYALYSAGFRPGGANRNRVPAEFTFFPVAYEPDKLVNLEAGIKSRWMDGRVQVNATVFFGEWENYQIETIDPSGQPCGPGESKFTDPCGQAFQVMVANVGDAEQTGIELDLRAAPSDRLDLGLNLTWVDAKTSQEFVVSTIVPKGTKLPNVPELKYNLWAEYTWPAAGSDMYVRGSYSWQDESRNQLEEFVGGIKVPGGNLATYIQPSFGIADLRVGIRNDEWTLEGFVSNLTDERAVLFNDPYFMDSYWGSLRVITNRPREFGVRFSYSWY